MTLKLRMSTSQVVGKIVKMHQQIRQISLLKFDLPPAAQERAKFSPEEKKIVDETLEIRAQNQLPFWELILQRSLQQQKVPVGILDAVAYHRSTEGRITRCEVTNNLEQSLDEQCKRLEPNEMLAISSEVICISGEPKHIPLLDLHCRPTPSNLELVLQVCKRIVQSEGVVLDSGNSYHFIGTGLMTFEERIHFLGRALLFSPIADGRWIGHQLQEPISALRISRKTESQGPPSVVGIVNA
jgi:hypothetical protein